MLLAFDDTDGPDGGCTTHLVFHVLLALPHLGLRSLPRLVRLDPNVPWKTRGNAAVVLDLGPPQGPQTRVGELRGHEILAFPEAPPAPADPDTLTTAWGVLRSQAQDGATPGVAVLGTVPSSLHYHAAVQTLVDPDEARATLEREGALHRSTGDGRALVGCLGAASWPGPPASYEFIAYREPQRWGTPRRITHEGFQALDSAGVTFHSWDADEGVPACIPATPCPVLVGLRGRDPDVLRDASVRTLTNAAEEAVDGWLLFATNQASGDHVTPVEGLLDAPEAGTVQVAATVVGGPETRRGGHVFIPMVDGTGVRFEATAFEPTKRFRRTLRALRPGDAVTAVGAFGDGVVRLEKLEVRSVAEVREKGTNPDCGACGDRMKSKGRGAGLRCPSCGATVPTAAAGSQALDRSALRGWHEVPVMARRHLHRPLAWDAAPTTTR